MILDQQGPHSLVNSASQLADLSGTTGAERRRIVLGVITVSITNYPNNATDIP